MNDLQFLTGPRSPTSTACRARRSSAARRRSTCRRSTPPGTPSDGLAEADLRLDGRQPGGRLVRHARHRRTRARSSSAMTRSGTLLAYTTDAPPARRARGRASTTTTRTPGDSRRDAASPGKPYELAVGVNVTFTAPGDDLLCGTATTTRWCSRTARSRARTSPTPGATPARPPRSARHAQSVAIPANRKPFIAIRAVDEQGNVGRVAPRRSPRLRAAAGRRRLC